MNNTELFEEGSNIAYIMSPNQDLLFGLSIELLPTKQKKNDRALSLKPSVDNRDKEFLYGLYMLLLFFGQKQLKDIIMGKIATCLQQSLQLIGKFENQTWQGHQQIMCRRVRNILGKRIKSLLFLKAELQLNYQYHNQKVTQIRVNTTQEIELLFKAFKTIYKREFGTVAFGERGFLQCSEWIAKLLKLQRRVTSFYQQDIIEFKCHNYTINTIEVYVEFSRQSKSCKYVRQKQQSIDVFNKIVKSHAELKNLSIQNLLLYSDIIKRFTSDDSSFEFNNHSFLKLLRVETSREVSMSCMVSVLHPSHHLTDQTTSTILDPQTQSALIEKSLLQEDVVRKRSSSAPSQSLMASMERSENQLRLPACNTVRLPRQLIPNINEIESFAHQSSFHNLHCQDSHSFLFHQDTLIFALKDTFETNLISNDSQQSIYKSSNSTLDQSRPSHSALLQQIDGRNQFHNKSIQKSLIMQPLFKNKEGLNGQNRRSKQKNRFQTKILIKAVQTEKTKSRQQLYLRNILNRKGIDCYFESLNSQTWLGKSSLFEKQRNEKGSSQKRYCLNLTIFK